MRHILALLPGLLLLLGFATRRSPRLSRILGSAGYNLIHFLRWLAIAFAMCINIAFCAVIGLPAMIVYIVITESYNSIKSLLRCWIQGRQQPNNSVIHLENVCIEEGHCGEDEVLVVKVEEDDPKEGWTKYTLPDTDDISELDLNVPNEMVHREGHWEGRGMFNRTDEDNARMVYKWMGVQVPSEEGHCGLDQVPKLDMQE